MQNGFIYLHRKVLESSVFEKPENLKVWIWCLLKANHKNNKVFIRGKDIELKRGQFLTGRITAGKELQHVSPRKLRTALSYLKATQRITIETTHHYSLITIINYNAYQNKNMITTQETTHKTTKNRHRPDTDPTLNNNDNNDNNDNKIILHSGVETPQGKEINEIISLFKELNPSYKRLYPNKTQRSALERMLSEHGKEKIEEAIALCIKVAGRKFAPVITTPCQLEEKLGQLVAYVKKEVKSPTITKI